MLRINKQQLDPALACSHLGALVSSVHALYDAAEQSMGAYRGSDCDALILASATKRARGVVQAAGFRGLEHFAEVVARRTSEAWTHRYLYIPCFDEHLYSDQDD